MTLYEAKVVAGVCQFLRKHHFKQVRYIPTRKRGEDIEAVTPDKRYLVTIEAKGATSSDPGSNRYGKPFTSTQVLDHVSKAVYCAAQHSLGNKLSGVAFPKNDDHIKRVNAILPILRKLGIEVFWVNANGKVEVTKHWRVWKKPENGKA